MTVVAQTQPAQQRKFVNVFEENRFLLQGLEGDLKEGDILFHLPKDAQSFNLKEELVIFNNTQIVQTLSWQEMDKAINMIHSNYQLMEESGRRYLKPCDKMVIGSNDPRHSEYNQRLREAGRGR